MLPFLLHISSAILVELASIDPQDISSMGHENMSDPDPSEDLQPGIP